MSGNRRNNNRRQQTQTPYYNPAVPMSSASASSSYQSTRHSGHSTWVWVIVGFVLLAVAIVAISSFTRKGDKALTTVIRETTEAAKKSGSWGGFIAFVVFAVAAFVGYRYVMSRGKMEGPKPLIKRNLVIPSPDVRKNIPFGEEKKPFQYGSKDGVNKEEFAKKRGEIQKLFVRKPPPP